MKKKDKTKGIIKPKPEERVCETKCATIQECDTNGCQPVETCWEECREEPIDV
ncbi:MAG: hypothetical protein ACOYWZ_07870 [Bacillota bacterium]